jgi:Integron cassette protein VCH_CASS1 chain
VSISINSLDELQRYLWRMMGRTGQQTSDVSAAILTLAGGILWMKDAGPIEVRTHKDELTNMFWVSLGGERYAFKYEGHLRRLEIRSSSGSGDLLLEVSDETDPAAIVAFFRHLGT